MVSTHSVTLLSQVHAATGNSCIAEHEKRCPPIARARRLSPGAHGRPPIPHPVGSSRRSQLLSPRTGQRARRPKAHAGRRPQALLSLGMGRHRETRRTNARVPCALPRHRLRVAVVGLGDSVWTCDLKRVVMSLWTAGGVSGRGPSAACCAVLVQMDGAARVPSTGLRTTHKPRHWSAAAPAAPPPHALLPSFGAANSRQPCSR